MNKYKPEYLGKVIPADDPSKLTDFVTKQYDSFSKIYDTVKDQSESISDVKAVDVGSSDPSSLSVKVSTDEETMEKIREAAKDDASVTVSGDVITAQDPE